MSRTRVLLSAVLGTVLLLVVAGPAQAGPAPLDDGTTSGGGTTPAPTGSGMDLWTYVGYAAAVLAVIAVVMVASIVLTRQTHSHAAHPA
jgi:hypothetical protein